MQPMEPVVGNTSGFKVCSTLTAVSVKLSLSVHHFTNLK